jgi:hypothetical protein
MRRLRRRLEPAGSNFAGRGSRARFSWACNAKTDPHRLAGCQAVEFALLGIKRRYAEVGIDIQEYNVHRESVSIGQSQVQPIAIGEHQPRTVRIERSAFPVAGTGKPSEFQAATDPRISPYRFVRRRGQLLEILGPRNPRQSLCEPGRWPLVLGHWAQEKRHRLDWTSALTHPDAVTVNQLASEPSARRKQQRSDTFDRRCRQPRRPITQLWAVAEE